MKTSIVFSKNTQTFRLMPQNYWIASVKDNKLVFDSWDGMAKELFRKNLFLKVRVFFSFLTRKF